MSAVAEGSGARWVVVKGAPEAVYPLLRSPPPGYSALARQHMALGRRVLALAERRIASGEAIGGEGAAEAPHSLDFCGFLLVESPLKADTAAVLAELRGSGHDCVMITGDGPLTAAEVARRCGILSQPPASTVALSYSAESKKFSWAPLTAGGPAGDPPRPFDGSAAALEALGAGGEGVVVSGDAVGALDFEILKRLARVAKVYARTSPRQKERVVRALNAGGRVTLMCGDGTNDVGALKQAHVGVSILSSPALEARVEGLAGRSPDLVTAEAPGNGSLETAGDPRGAARPSASYGPNGGPAKPPGGPAGSASYGPTDRVGEPRSVDLKRQRERARADRAMRILLEQSEADGDPTLVRLGDASIASPFTARRTSVDCVRSVVLQGRCTLVTTLQIFKILALNCLVSAFMMSALFLEGVKQGDAQMTAAGVAVAALFFATSRAAPLPVLSRRRPPSRVFHAALLLSVALQAAVHLALMLLAVRLGRAAMPSGGLDLAPDGPFRPNALNAAVYLLSVAQTATTFAANYRGAPFMMDLRDHRLLSGMLAAIYAAVAMAAAGLPPLRALLQLVDLGAPLKAKLLAIMAADTAACVAIDRAARLLE